MDMLRVFFAKQYEFAYFSKSDFMSKRTEVHLDHFGNIPFQISGSQACKKSRGLRIKSRHLLLKKMYPFKKMQSK